MYRDELLGGELIVVKHHGCPIEHRKPLLNQVRNAQITLLVRITGRFSPTPDEAGSRGDLALFHTLLAGV